MSSDSILNSIADMGNPTELAVTLATMKALSKSEEERMRILVACEFSGVVRDAFRARGQNAVSCDLLPTEREGPHIQDDVMNHLTDGWDLMVAFPPCTYLTVTGNKWFKPEFKTRFPDREQKRTEAIRFFMTLIGAPIPRIAVENPVGIMSRHYRKPTQIIQPYHFGEAESKQTCLWLKNLDRLRPTKMVEPIRYRYRDGRLDSRWHVETMGLPPLERMKARSKTFQGVADAMAQQWGDEVRKRE